MTFPVTYRALLERRGVSLEALDLGERAVCREDALRAVELIESEGRAVLGRQDETSEAFVVRSCAETRRYITNYPDPTQGQALFVLVLEDGTPT